jgi:hypothetical protein
MATLLLCWRKDNRVITSPKYLPRHAPEKLSSSQFGTDLSTEILLHVDVCISPAQHSHNTTTDFSCVPLRTTILFRC